MKIAVDRFHQKGHVHPMCKTTTNADCICNGNREVFQSINTSVAEQCSSYLSKFKRCMRGLAFPHSTPFMLLLLHVWNIKKTQMRADDFGLAAQYLKSMQPTFLTKCVFETVYVITQSHLRTTTVYQHPSTPMNLMKTSPFSLNTTWWSILCETCIFLYFSVIHESDNQDF